MDTIPEADLEHRRVYRIQSRNLVVGVWSAPTRGFIGVRHKFASTYLFEEYHHDNGAPYGTAQAIEAYDLLVPETVPIAEYLGSLCRTCRKPVENMGPGEVKRNGEMKTVQCIGWRHIAEEDRVCEADETYCAMAWTNDDLFTLLLPYDQEINAQRAAEFKRDEEARLSRKWRPQTQAEYNREVATKAVTEWRREAYAAVADDDREAHKALSAEFMDRFAEACKANPLPEETW